MYKDNRIRINFSLKEYRYRIWFNDDKPPTFSGLGPFVIDKFMLYIMQSEKSSQQTKLLFKSS